MDIETIRKRRISDIMEDIIKLTKERDEALAKLAAMESQEPFAYCFTDVNCKPTALCDSPDHAHSNDGRLITSLYAKPVPADKPEIVITDHEHRPMTYWGGLADKPAVAVPDGWRLVPAEVDRDTALSMVMAAAKANGLSTEHEPTEQEIENSWKFANAVLAAAPSHSRQSTQRIANKDSMGNYGLPPIVGSLASLPNEIIEIIEKYGNACAAIAKKGKRLKITENDMHEIAKNYCDWKSEEFYIAWFNMRGRELLKKLNGEKADRCPSHESEQEKNK